MEEIIHDRRVAGGEEIIVFDLEKAMGEKRKAGSIAFDYLAVGPADKSGFKKKLVLIAKMNNQKDVRVSYYTSRFGTVYPADNNRSNYIRYHLRIIDTIRALYVKLSKSKGDTKEDTTKDNDPNNYMELSHDDTMELIQGIDGVGKKTAKRVISAMQKGDSISDVKYLSESAAEEIRQVLDGVVLV